MLEKSREKWMQGMAMEIEIYRHIVLNTRKDELGDDIHDQMIELWNFDDKKSTFKKFFQLSSWEKHPYGEGVLKKYRLNLDAVVDVFSDIL